MIGPLCFLFCKPLVSFISMIYLLTIYISTIYHKKMTSEEMHLRLSLRADNVTRADKIF